MELAPLARQQFSDNNGVPLASGKLYTYEAGSSTPKLTYSDRAGTNNANPVVMDANGWCDLWLGSGKYKFILKDSSDNLIWTKDDVAIPYEAALASAFWRDVVYLTSADSPYSLTQSSNGKLFSVDATSGAVVVNMPQISTIDLPYNIGFKLTNATNTLTINRAGTDTIEGATSKILNTTSASCQLIGDIDKSPDQWAVLDFGVVDASGYPTVTAISEDFVPIVDTSDSNRNKKATFKNFKNATYRSVIVTDAVGADDETMALSGASFTSTLPAIGVAGKRYKFIHKGTSLTQVYTLATTSAQTIGGIASGSYALWTNGEVLELEDPGTGTDWLIIRRKTATTWSSDVVIPWTATSAYVFTVTAANATLGTTYTNSGFTYTVSTTISGTTTLTCSGTGTPAASGTLTKVGSGAGDSTITYSSKTITGQPIIGTSTSNRQIWRRNSDEIDIYFEYATTGAGTGGVGNMIQLFPTGVVMDTTQISLLTTVAVAQNALLKPTSEVGWATGLYGAGPTDIISYRIIPYSNSGVRFSGYATASGGTLDGGANYGFGNASANVFGRMKFKVVGWMP